MIQRGDSSCFSLETRSQGLEVDLDRDDSPQSRIASSVDFAHAARTDQTFDFVWSETRTFRQLLPLRRRGFEEFVHNVGI